MNYTKGPWKYNEEPRAKFSMIGNGDTVVCGLPNPLYADWRELEEMRANARLIVSAPEMYEELNRIYQWCLERSMAPQDLYDKLALHIIPILAKVEGKETRV